MKKTLHVHLFSVLLISTATLVQAQQADRFAYAVTDVTKGGSGWNALRKLDLQTGEYSAVLLNGTDQNTVAFDAVSKKQVTAQPDAKYGTLLQAPFSTGVAAVAYDRKHNRLYYTPMFIDQLRYIDLKTMKLYYVTDQPFTKLGTMHNDEGKCITRMVIAPDGNGYALTNDGNTFIQFTTGKKTKITQLGSLVDDPSNNGISVHNRCSSYGGDMISDDDGNLYIISARNNVFKVNTETKVAKHLGSIEGLPGNFTANGAVVDAEGSLLVSSAVTDNSYYVVDTKSWKASPYAAPAGVYRSSDLANSNYLASSKTSTIESIARLQPALSNAIQVFPNPATGNRFNLQFNNIPAGDYVVELTDVSGRTVVRRQVTINNEYQIQKIQLAATNAKGMYLVKVSDRKNKSVFEQKVLVQ